jgi:hypothetical protein
MAHFGLGALEELADDARRWPAALVELSGHCLERVVELLERCESFFGA